MRGTVIGLLTVSYTVNTGIPVTVEKNHKKSPSLMPSSVILNSIFVL